MMQASIFPSTESFHEIEIVVNYQSVNDSQPGSFYWQLITVAFDANFHDKTRNTRSNGNNSFKIRAL